MPPRQLPKRAPLIELKARVYDTGDPKTFGTVRFAGPEVSQVAWDDGRVRFVNNDYLRVVEEK